jgi:hypothetical protein
MGEDTPLVKGGALLRRRTWAWIALGGVLIAIVALIDVQITDPRVTVRWRTEVGHADRVVLERRYGLGNGEQMEGTGWRYQLRDRSRDNIRALVQDPAVDDTGYIDRDAFAAENQQVRATIRPLPYPFSDRFDRPSQLLQLHQTVWLLLGGGVLLWAARASSERRRRHATVATLLLIGVLAWTLPISPSFVHMGDANQLTQNRQRFESYAGVHQIRFEAHLSYAILGQLDRLFGRTDDAPRRAQITLARGTTVWFVLCALAIGFLKHWSPLILRYLGLALLAPSALLYFGWHEVGYMSLNVAAFPLLARGLRNGGWRLEAGSALAGLGAALHGFGLVSLIGAWLAALAARARFANRVGRVLRSAAWGTAAYAGWTAVYIIVLKLPIVLGHAESFPWRPWFRDEIMEGRLNVAIFSATGARDLLFTGWVVGAPLLLVAASLWRQYGDDVRTALGYALSSMIFTILIWNVLGLGDEMDLVFAGFPAVYALAWACAHDPTRTKIAAALLVSAHYAFWRICLDPQFRNAALF